MRKGCIYESIVCTWNPDGTPNAAPMGVSVLESNILGIRPFTDTATYRNLLRAGCATVNFSSDPFLYYFSAFKYLKGESLKGMFKCSSVVNSPEIRKADAVLNVEVEQVEGDEDKRALFKCNIVSAKGFRVRKAEPYSRAPHALMECIIHATRIRPYAEANISEARRLLDLIAHHRSVIMKVAKQSKYARAADEIYSYCREVFTEYETKHKDA
ncbi:MAG: DUF447 family protein [Nitrososphaerales archaeon]